jgi:hypothetical protein
VNTNGIEKTLHVLQGARAHVEDMLQLSLERDCARKKKAITAGAAARMD